MQTYVLKLDCETCGEPMENRVMDLTAVPGAELVVDIEMLSQESFECDNCGGRTHLDDFTPFHEPGREPEEDEDEGEE